MAGTAAPPRRQYADAATLCVIYVALVVLIPSRLVLAGLPLDVPPAMLAGLAMGACWFCAQMLSDVGMAKGRNAARTAIFLFAVALVASYGIGTLRYLPYDQLKSADRTLLIMLSFVAVGLLACDGIRSLVRLDTVLTAVTRAIAVMAVVGLLQFFAGVDLAQYLVLPGLRENSPLEFVLARSDFRRPAGTAGHPIEFGVVCALAVPIAAHYAFHARELGRRAKLDWLCLALVSTGAFVSLSRSAILGLLVASLVLLPTWSGQRRIRTLIAAVLFLGVMRLFQDGLVGTLISLFRNISSDPSIQGRTDDYATTGESIAAFPLLGRGPGTYLPSTYGPLDNQYLGSLVETGYLGLGTLILVFLAGGYCAVAARLRTSDPRQRDLAQTLLACLTISAVSSFTYDTFAFTIASGLMFLLVGLAGTLLRIQRANTIEPVHARTRT